MAAAGTGTVKLVVRGVGVTVEVNDGVTTVGEVRAAAGAAAPGWSVDSIKLLVHGALVPAAADDEVAAAHGILSGATVMVVGSSAAARAAAADKTGLPAVRDDFVAPRPGGMARPGGVGGRRPLPTLRDGSGRQYGFGAIATLPGFVDADAAYDVLHRVAVHPGVVAVMKAHGWFVPVLDELFPAGQVGVDPVCVLGLNTGRGARISLRIRTDDLEGYVKFPMVMETVWHELAHNSLSEHTRDFYNLVSALKAEGAASDWTATPGHRLSDDPSIAFFAPPGGVVIAANSRYPARTRSASSGSGGGGSSGGGTVSGGGGSHLTSADAATTTPLAATAAEAAAHAAAARVAAAAAARAAAAAPAAAAEPVMPAPPTTHIPSDVAAPPPPTIMDDAPPTHNDGSAESIEVTLRDALGLLAASCLASGASMSEAVRTVRDVVTRAAGVLTPTGTLAPGGDAKYLRLRPANDAFRRRTGGADAAVAFLVAAGWQPDDPAGEWYALRLPADGERLALAVALATEAAESYT